MGASKGLFPSMGTDVPCSLRRFVERLVAMRARVAFPPIAKSSKGFAGVERRILHAVGELSGECRVVNGSGRGWCIC